MQANNPLIIPLRVSPDEFFKRYIDILNPLLNLSPGEARVLEAFLKFHYQLRKNAQANQILFRRNSLKRIRESLKMNVTSFNNYKFKLRKKDILRKNAINELLTKNYPTNGKLTIAFILTINATTPKNTKVLSVNGAHLQSTPS